MRFVLQHKTRGRTPKKLLKIRILNLFCAAIGGVIDAVVYEGESRRSHAKDFLWKSGDGECPEGFFKTNERNYLRGTVIGHGVVPVKRCISILKNAGYETAISRSNSKEWKKI